MKFFGVTTSSPNRFFHIHFSGIEIQLGAEFRPALSGLSGGFLRVVRRLVPASALFVASVFCLHCAKPNVAHRIEASRQGGEDELAGEEGRPHQIGYASWYGSRLDGFQYKKTANGETMIPEAWTCAHPSLPFGAIVRVENLSNNRSVLLRVNDRGPYINGRVIDVSQRGAKEIGILKSGIAKVRVHVIKNILQTNTVEAPGRTQPPDPVSDPVYPPPVFKSTDISAAFVPLADTLLKVGEKLRQKRPEPSGELIQNLQEILKRIKNRRFEPFIRQG